MLNEVQIAGSCWRPLLLLLLTPRLMRMHWLRPRPLLLLLHSSAGSDLIGGSWLIPSNLGQCLCRNILETRMKTDSF